MWYPTSLDIVKRYPGKWLTDEDLKDPSLARQKQEYDEAMALHRWWTVERFEELAEEERCYQAMNKHVEAGDKVAYKDAQTAWLEYTRQNEEREDEMFSRLIKIRRSLWT